MPAGSRCHGTIINCEYVERGTPVIYLESKHRTDITGASVQHDPLSKLSHRGSKQSSVMRMIDKGE